MFIGKRNLGKCPGCFGSGVQRNIKTGLRELCPICHGTGRFHKKEKPWRMSPPKIYW